MATYHLKTPLTENDVRDLRVDDIVFLTGIVVTARDQAHKRALMFLGEGKALPISLEGLAVYHCGPIIRKKGKEYVALAAGPTTSARLEVYEDKYIEAFKPRIIIGKGGMGKRTEEALSNVGSVYCAFTGGAAVLAAQAVNYVREVHWLDLGMPEAMWVLEVREFGPLIVAIDSLGGNLYSQVAADVDKCQRQIHEKLSSVGGLG